MIDVTNFDIIEHLQNKVKELEELLREAKAALQDTLFVAGTGANQTERIMVSAAESVTDRITSALEGEVVMTKQEKNRRQMSTSGCKCDHTPEGMDWDGLHMEES